MFFPEYPDDESRFRKLAREIADEKIRPTAITDERAHVFRRDIFSSLAQSGLTALTIPEVFGGKAAHPRVFYGVIEELARASASYAITLGVTNLVQGALVAFGSEAQKETTLKPLAAGRFLGAFALSEPGSGSDAAALRTKAVLEGTQYRINGTKCWCSNGGLADVYLLMARTSDEGAKGITSFLIPKDHPGFRIGKKEKKLGLWASTLTELIFEDCLVPESFRIGKVGEGFQVALSQLDAGRISIAAVGAGLSEEALRRVWKWGQSRPGLFTEGVKWKFAEHYASLQAVKALIRLAAEEKAKGTRISGLASQAKLLGSDLAMLVTSDALGAMGPEAMEEETGMERLFRDAKALQIVEGTNQIQKLVLTRELDKLLAT